MVAAGAAGVESSGEEVNWSVDCSEAELCEGGV